MVIENKIDYSEVLLMIKKGIAEIIDDNIQNGDGAYENLNVQITNEQFFVNREKEKALQRNAIYMVVKFGAAAVDYGVTVLPITIVATSEANKCDICQRLLQDFVTTSNMGANNTKTVQQFYESPVVTSNFNEMYEDFRSILTVGGSFVISESANPFDLYWYNEDAQKWQEVYFINSNLGANFQVEPKPFYNSNNYTRSIGVMGTVTFNISSVLLTDGAFYDEMMKFVTQKNNYTIDTNPYLLDEQTGEPIINVETNLPIDNPNYLKKVQDISWTPVNINKDLIFKLAFRNNQELVDFFKIANVDIQQVLKKIPMITLVFSN